MREFDTPCLTQAIAEGRAAGLHIDLQNGFFTPESAIAFPEANKVAQHLRAAAIPNFWVAATTGWKISSYRQFSFDCVAPGWRLHDSLDTHADDLVFQKTGQALFPPDVDHTARAIRDRNVDTLLVTGVKHSHCVRDTVISALRRDFNVCVVIDATDRPMDMFGTYASEITGALPSERHRNLSVISTRTLTQALFSAREKAAPVLS